MTPWEGTKRVRLVRDKARFLGGIQRRCMALALEGIVVFNAEGLGHLILLGNYRSSLQVLVDRHLVR